MLSTLPLGYNHPVFSTNEFKSDLLTFGGLKPSTGRILTNFIDDFVKEFHDFTNSNHFHKYFFIHGGGLAVENALKISFDWKRHINEINGDSIECKMESISLKNGFHGITGYGMSISTNNLKISDYPKLDWPKFDFPCSDCYKDGKCSTGYTSNEKSFLESIETYISSKGKEYIASIIIELVQGRWRQPFAQIMSMD